MGKPTKVIVSVLTILVILIALLGGLLVFFFDPNDYKSVISRAVKEQVGRDIVFDGKLKLSLFPWLGFSAETLTLSNAQGFDGNPFATIAECEIKISWLALIAKQVEISQITVKNLVLNLSRDQNGINNWDDLIKSGQAKRSVSPLPDNGQQVASDALQKILIDGLAIENAHISWNNLQTEKHLEIKNINLNAGRFMVNAPMPIDFSFTVLVPDAKVNGSIKFSAELTVSEKLDRFVFTHSLLESITAGEMVPGKSVALTINSDVTLDVANQEVKLAGLRLNSGDLKVSAELMATNIKESAVLQGSVGLEPFNLAKVLKEWAIAVPEMKDKSALTNLTANFDLHATENLLDFSSISMRLDDSKIKGLVQIRNITQPTFDFQLEIDAIDIDRYLAPNASKRKPVSNPASALAVGAAIIPVETLKELHADVDLMLEELRVSGLAMQNIHVVLSEKNGLSRRGR